METNADQLDVVRTALTAMKSSIHVRPVIFLDAELPFVPEQKAPGTSAYRAQLTSSSATRKSDRASINSQSLIDQVAKDAARTMS